MGCTADDPTPEEQGRAMGELANELGGEGVTFVATLMARNERERERIEERIREADEQKIRALTERAERAEAELEAVRANFERLLYPAEERVEFFRQSSQ